MPPRDAIDGPVNVASMNHLVPAPGGYAWAVTAAVLLSYAQAGSPALIPRSRAPSGCPGKARQSMDSIRPAAWAGCPGNSRPGKGSGSEQD